MSTIPRILPVFRGPEPVVDWDTVDDPVGKMKEHLQTAVTLELYTTPLYLFALYSVNGSAPAKGAIAKVAQEEMLHFALAGNILCAIGGKPKLYGEGFTPKYPTLIFSDNVQLNLRGTTKENLETFVMLERPTPQAKRPEREDGNVLPNYTSIGAFYKSIEDGLAILHRMYGDEFFRRAPLCQFKPGDGSHHQIVFIDSLASAKSAMKLIVDQGEGSGGADGHYQIFKGLVSSGVPHHNVVDDPKTEAFKDKPFYKAMLACDSAYCYLLSTIEILWTYDGSQRDQLINNNIGNLMYVIKIISEYLVQQDAGNTKRAASCFNLYQPADLLPRLAQLQRETNAAVEASPELSGIKQVIDGLVNIDSLTG